jgi:RND superfamily putative drug exporter
MLQEIARRAIAAPRRIIGVAILVFIAAAIFGILVARSLSPGGFQDPHSESAQAIKALTDKFGRSGQKMLILATAPAGAGSEQARQVGTDIVDQLQRSPLVFDVSSAWTMPCYEPTTAAADRVCDQVVMEAIAIPPSVLVLVRVLGGHLASCAQLRIVQ